MGQNMAMESTKQNKFRLNGPNKCVFLLDFVVMI